MITRTVAGLILTLAFTVRAADDPVIVTPSEDVAAQTPGELAFPGVPVTRFVLRLRESADDAYERGSFRYAYRLYRDGLAPRADKFAQYMTSFMLARGQGVPRDPVAASAWFHLAAERGNRKLVAVYEQSLTSMNDAEAKQADEIYRGLPEQYGDRAIVARLVRDDRRSLQRGTGSRGGNVTMLDLAAHRRYERVREQIEIRMKFLEGDVELRELELIDDAPDVSAVSGSGN